MFLCGHRWVFSGIIYYCVFSLILMYISRTARYSKIKLYIVLSCLNIQDNNRYNIYIQLLIQYQDCDVKNVKNLALS